MKKIFKTLAIVAVAALGFACQNEIDEQVNGNEGEKVTVEVVGSVADLTRSTFGAIDTEKNKVPSTWSGNEKVGFSALASLDKTEENEGSVVAATNTPEAGANEALFSVEFDAIEEGNTVFAVSPYNTGSWALGGFSGITTKYQEFYLTIPEAQTPLANSVEESTHLMVGEATYEGGAMTMTFQHVAAYAKMNITNFGGNGVKEIAVTFPTNVVGESLYYIYAGTNAGTITNLKSATVTINPENVSNFANGVWFTVAPVGALVGDMKVVVTDEDDKTYTKNITLTAEKGISFVKGQVSEFTVNMSGIAADVVAPAEDYSGKYIIVAQKDGKYYYMSTWKDGQSAITGGNNRTAVDSGVATITDYTSEADFAETLDTKYVWTIASVDGGYTIANSDSSAWLYLGSNENRAKMTTNESQKETFTISKGDNVYTIKATSYTRTLALNKDNSNSLFNCYASGAYVYDLVLIPYTGTVKVKEATTIELDAYENTVDIKEGTEAASNNFIEPNATVLDASDVAVEGAKLTYTSNKADVATVNAENGNVTFTGGTGSVTITISYAGDDNYKGCSAEYTITVEDSSVAAEEKTLTINTSHFNSTSYAANNNSKDIEGITVTSYQVMYQNSCMQWQKSKGYIYNDTNMGKIKSIEFEGVTGGTFSVLGVASAGATSGTSIGSVTQDVTLDVAAKGDFSYFYIKVGGATGKCQSIKVTYVK